MLKDKEMKERDEVVASILINYDKLSPYNRGRLSMLADILKEKYPEVNSNQCHEVE